MGPNDTIGGRQLTFDRGRTGPAAIQAIDRDSEASLYVHDRTLARPPEERMNGP